MSNDVAISEIVHDIIDAQPFSADNDATRVWQLFKDANEAPKYLSAIAVLISARLRPEVTDEMVERAEYEYRIVGSMRAALTAALNPEADNG